MMTSPDDDLDPCDRKALELALAMGRVAEPNRFGAATTENWLELARAAAYSLQFKTLRLKPWEPPPCTVDEDDPQPGDEPAVRFLRKMLEAGISRYHPDPLATLAEAEERAAKQRSTAPRRKKVAARPRSGVAEPVADTR
jgi:hypothetical protein